MMILDVGLTDIDFEGGVTVGPILQVRSSTIGDAVVGRQQIQLAELNHLLLLQEAIPFILNSYSNDGLMPEDADWYKI